MADDSKKGTFSRDRLPVARDYAPRRSRRGMVLIGLGLTVVFAGVVAWSLLFRSGSFVAGGPLSSAHSTIENDCSRCHRPVTLQSGLGGVRTGAVEDSRCMDCHRSGPAKIGLYSLARHFVYARAETTDLSHKLTRYAGERTDCASCHPEHRGRLAALTQVTDANCLSCHRYGSFTQRHPEFDFLAEHVPDDSTLVFTHTHHTQIIYDKYGLLNPCQYCHVPARDGKGFMPIRFEPHCGECHMDGSRGTGLLPVATGDQVGVETLDTIKARGEPGTYWAHVANPSEYSSLGPTLYGKTAVVHRDPWVLENLRALRRSLYPGLGMADVLDTYGIASNESPALLYREVADRLGQYASALNARREQAVRQDLTVFFRNNLNRARRQIADPSSFLPAAPFLSLYQSAVPSLTAGKRQAMLTLADSLTSTCRLCHLVENASIARVQKDQRALIRARFDHSAHSNIDCLDCHSRIPLQLEDLAAYTKKPLPRSAEAASIQNLPGIKVCQECHRPGKVSSACTTCHDFHPGKPGTGLVVGM